MQCPGVSPTVVRSPDKRDKHLVLIVAVVGARVAPSVLVAQNGGPGAPGAKPYAPPKTRWGEPDLQGTFFDRTSRSFERPAIVNGREFFTAQEFGAREKSATER